MTKIFLSRILQYFTIFGLFFVFAACGACGGGGGSKSNTNVSNGSNVTTSQPPTGMCADVPATQYPAVMAERPFVGVGINQLSYYDGAFAMADLVRESEFRKTNWEYAISLDANGAPQSDFFMIFSTSKIGAGIYKLSFTGQASDSINANFGAAIQNKAYNPTTNITTADMVLITPSIGNNWLTFSNTKRTAASTGADGVTNIHLWRPGYATDGSAVFTSEFIAAMQKFQLIRTMDFVQANLNPTQTWAERTKPDFLGYTGQIRDYTVTPSSLFRDAKGQSWELIVLLANATGNDIWLNVPVNANDDYIIKLAQLLLYGSDGTTPYTCTQAHPVYPPLNPGLKIYLEYGNELWNTGAGFSGYGWALAQANNVRTDITHPIAYDAVVTDQNIALRRWIAYRSSIISLTFRSVFGDAAMMSVVRPILASQVGDGNAYLSYGLAWADGFYSKVRSLPINAIARPVNEIWYGGGGAAYYDSTTAPSSVDPTIMTNYFLGLPSSTFADNTAIDAMWTRAYGLHTTAYEGGPGPGGSPLGGVTGSASLSYTYNADPRMKDRMLIAHDIWQANGGEGLTYYVYSAAAPWNFSDDPANLVASDTTSIKMQAITAIRNAIQAQPVPPVTLGTAVPATITFSDPVLKRISGGFPGYPTTFSPGVVGNYLRLDTTYYDDAAKSGFLAVPIRNTASAANFSFSIKTINAKATDKIELLINGVSAGVWSGFATGVPNTIVESSPIVFNLPSGLSMVRVRVVKNSLVSMAISDGVYVNSLVVQ